MVNELLGMDIVLDPKGFPTVSVSGLVVLENFAFDPSRYTIAS